MGIRGLTDRGSAFPEIGFIRKGKKEGNAMIDLQYFRVEFAEEETQAEFNELYKNDAGKVEPVEIKIMFPFDDIERNWEAWLEAYTAGRMVARSDGEKMLYWVDAKTGEMKVIRSVDATGKEVLMPANYKVGTYQTQKGQTKDILLKPVGRLKVVLPELKRLAYVTVHTTSYHDIINISQQLDALKVVNGNRLAGIPLMLRRRPRNISCPDTREPGKKIRREKWLLSIEADPVWVQMQLIALKQKALPGAGDIALLIGKTEETNDIEEPENLPEEMIDDEMDVTNGEFSELDERYTTELEPAEESTVEPVSTADSVKVTILETAEKWEGKKISDGKRGVLVPVIETCFAAGDATGKRHQLQKFLTGKSSLTEIPDNFLIALYTWMKPHQDSGGAWLPNPESALQANQIISFLDAANGQLNLLELQEAQQPV